ncbi:efflux RND transporter periplasmic adaptor subunit [Reyranella sp.]|uniref:efflux RND transporter periplasmic adaptor subunit n=1 Tax=Reyranella sp. TaxID=1929291 RepID=UPI003D0C1A6D
MISLRIAVPFALVCVVGAVLLVRGEGRAVPAETATPQTVGVMTMVPATRPYLRELPGRIAPTRIAEVRARVPGVVMVRTFAQGSEVSAGDVLYELDPTPYQVELSAMSAALEKAVAVFEHETRQAQRVEALVATRAASQSQFEVASASARQAKADVALRQADVARAKLNLDYTTVRAPIGGRIGRARVTEGALVGQGEATHLATIQQIRTVYADFTQSVTEMHQLRRALAKGDLEAAGPEAAKVRLVLDNGEAYDHDGKLLFSDTTVDPSTGQVTLRAEFPNPDGDLLPGMYVRVQIVQGVDPDALAVPQQAVRRNDAGMSEVFVLRDDNRAVSQPVRLGRVVSGNWLIEEGLKPGDRVVVDGFQKFVAGDVVTPQPWQSERRADSSIR